jgi:hypothetical protein
LRRVLNENEIFERSKVRDILENSLIRDAA